MIDEAIKLKPGKVVIIDAADFGGHTGENQAYWKKDISDTSLSTHSFSLNILAAIIEEETDAEVFFLGIQPASIQWSEGLSEPIKSTAREIISCIKTFNLKIF